MHTRALRCWLDVSEQQRSEACRIGAGCCGRRPARAAAHMRVSPDVFDDVLIDIRADMNTHMCEVTADAPPARSTAVRRERRPGDAARQRTACGCAVFTPYSCYGVCAADVFWEVGVGGPLLFASHRRVVALELRFSIEPLDGNARPVQCPDGLAHGMGTATACAITSNVAQHLSTHRNSRTEHALSHR